MNADGDGEEMTWLAEDSEILIRDDSFNEFSNGAVMEPTFGTVDGIFEKIGPCGRYQYMRGFLLCMLNIPMTYQILIMYFTGHNPNWRCVNGTNSACNFTKEISPAHVDQFHARCNMPRKSWEYVTPRKFSFITEFDLVCDRNPLAAFANSAMYMGWGIGCIPLGIAADYIGRRPVLFLGYTVVLSSLLASAFVTAVWQFILLRAVTGFFLTGYSVSAFVLVSEIVGAKFRSLTGNVYFVFGTCALLILTLQAYYIQEWRKLSVICSAPYLGCIMLFWLIDESPRWLSSHGYLVRSTKVMKKIAAINRRPYPSQQIVESSDSRRSRGNFTDLFCPAKQLMKTIPLSIGWMIVAMTFYGISLAAGDLSGNMYRDFALVSLIEFPAMPLTVLLLEKLGRRKASVACMVAAGIFCCSVPMFPEKSSNKIYATLRVVAGMAGKLCNVIAFGAYYVWTGELYPTSIRTQGLSFASLSARVGATPAPFLTESLKLINPSLPFVLMGVLSILSGLLTLTLPETVGKPTLESIDASLKEPCESNGNVIAMEEIIDCHADEDILDEDPYDLNEENALIQSGR